MLFRYLLWFAILFCLVATQMQNAARKLCSVIQEQTDLDCPCRFPELPCRVPGSVCLPRNFNGAGMDTELRCDCTLSYERELDKYCIERYFPEADPGTSSPPPQPVETPNEPDFLVEPRGGQGLPKRPVKKPPFRTVLITSSPLHANPRTTRARQPFHRPDPQSGKGFGAEDPSLETILNFSAPKPRLPFPPFSKAMGPSFNKGANAKRPSTKSPLKRTTKTLPRADGSVVVSGWYPDIWPAVGLNYSI